MRYDKKLFEVIWMCSGFCISYIVPNDDYYLNHCLPVANNEEDMEVIGNIYENPDLLKSI